jgi:hypothetical protein
MTASWSTISDVRVGTGVSSNGGVVVVPVSSTVSFCVSEDGRILE